MPQFWFESFYWRQRYNTIQWLTMSVRRTVERSYHYNTLLISGNRCEIESHWSSATAHKFTSSSFHCVHFKLFVAIERNGRSLKMIVHLYIRSLFSEARKFCFIRHSTDNKNTQLTPTAHLTFKPSELSNTDWHLWKIA